MDQDLAPHGPSALSDLSDLSESEEDGPAITPPLTAARAPAPSVAAAVAQPGVERTKRQRKNDRRRGPRNVERYAAQLASGNEYKACATRHRSIAAANALPSDLSPEAMEAKTTKPGWVGTYDKKEARRVWRLEEARELGVTVVPWNGV